MRSIIFPRTGLLFLCSLLFVPQIASPQSPRAPKTTRSPAPRDASPARDELEKRLAAARAARDSGDIDGAARANKQVIALALKQLGRMRLLEAAFPQAVEIYRRSLDFSEEPETRVDLAIAEVGAARPDDAISDATKALRVLPDDARALTVRGRTLLDQHDTD